MQEKNHCIFLAGKPGNMCTENLYTAARGVRGKGTEVKSVEKELRGTAPRRAG